ncbi:MAG TPA: type II toxin-antitoxin system RelE/ParE family toxin [Pirellulales bacterium]|nr:type II toxin-antitoxin system RelE/ParE family toxin [Pirellulales bacterium]
MGRLVWDRKAREDIKSIWRWIAQSNLSAADRVYDDIWQTARLIATQPEMGEPRPELMVNLRSFSVGSYVLYYRPRRDGIEVVRILHGARDVDSAFGGKRSR